MIPKKDITKIYDAALAVFADFGFKKATLDDIAGNLDMTSGNFYRYFKSKRDLYEQTVGHVLRQWQVYSFDTGKPDADIRTRFKTIGSRAVKYLSINDTFRRLLIRDPDIFAIFPQNDPYETINNDSITLVKSMLKKGIASKEFREVDPEATTQLLWFVYKTFIVQIYVKNQGREIQDIWEVFIYLITNGLFSVPDKP